MNRLTVVPVLLVALLLAPSAIGGPQPHLLDALYRDVALLPAVNPQSLTAKLDAAGGAICRGQTNTALNILGAFGNELDAKASKAGIDNPNIRTTRADLALVVSALGTGEVPPGPC